jgi:hypothetical protein
MIPKNGGTVAPQAIYIINPTHDRACKAGEILPRRSR